MCGERARRVCIYTRTHTQYTTRGVNERDAAHDILRTEGDAHRRAPGAGVRHRAMLHRGILIRVGRIGVCDVILHNN